MKRSDRIEVRVDPDRAARIRHAAKLEHTSLSAFVVAAASERAEHVIANLQETVVPSEYFDALLEALDEPGETIPALKRARDRAAEVIERR